ncbi:MAG: prepilin-type N-terminal cleavage/methylation domain-containing protein [Planctomycetes bacterium]|nr:prepilin-type N-terminal cleavage/methylation domain-containing protein [Planctomycetota bacterium]
MRTRRSTRAGYTLVEIIVVMTLIVIIAAISVPVVRTMMTDTRITAGADALRRRLQLGDHRHLRTHRRGSR